jgi:hypothetical protein
MLDDTIEINGLTFRVTVERDEDMGEPWKEHDGHGVVSNWTTRSKSPKWRDGPDMNVLDFIATLARSDLAPCLKHGDIIHCKPYEGGVFHGGSYITTRLFTCRFEDGTTKTYWLNVGEPLEVK